MDSLKGSSLSAKLHCIWANLTQPNFGPWVWVWCKSNHIVSKNLVLHGNEAVEAVGRPQRKLIVCKSALHLELLGLSKDELRVSERPLASSEIFPHKNAAKLLMKLPTQKGNYLHLIVAILVSNLFL